MFCVNVATPPEHNEELVAVAMQMSLVPRAWLEHGPADDMIGTGGLFVDQELHLHVDPAVLAHKAGNFRHVAQIGAVHFCGPWRARAGWFCCGAWFQRRSRSPFLHD